MLLCENKMSLYNIYFDKQEINFISFTEENYFN